MTRRRPGRASALACALLVLILAAGRSAAGPNLGGTLVVHDSGLVYTSGIGIYPTLAPDSCAVIDAEVPVAVPPDGQGWVWKIYAAFPAGSLPRLRAISFGSTWDPQVVHMLAGGLPNPYGDFEIAQPGWPTQPDQGTGISFGTVKTSRLSEIYWMAGYAYAPGAWRLAPHPVQETIFVDDATPAHSDPIVGLGTLGFGQPGEVACPVVLGACCFAGGSCEVMDLASCLAAGGVEWGGHVTCEPYPCTTTSGACCLPDGSCVMRDGFQCLSGGGAFAGQGTTCLPNHCPPPTGACCYLGGFCDMRASSSCAAAGGTWQGAGASCAPNPCPQPPPQAACCMPSGICNLRTVEQCAQQGGSYQGVDSDCNPNPCPQPNGACCLSDETCVVESAAACTALGGAWLGAGQACWFGRCEYLSGACCYPNGTCVVNLFTACPGIFLANQACQPNPCDVYVGACCFHDGSCLIVAGTLCFGSGGWHWQPGVTCAPNPCDDTTPVERTTWGRIKHSYY
jgi:hypothetical protein